MFSLTSRLALGRKALPCFPGLLPCFPGLQLQGGHHCLGAGCQPAPPPLQSLLSLPDMMLDSSPCLSLDGFSREAVTALLTFLYRGSVGELGDKLTSNVNIICQVFKRWSRDYVEFIKLCCALRSVHSTDNILAVLMIFTGLILTSRSIL